MNSVTYEIIVNAEYNRSTHAIRDVGKDLSIIQVLNRFLFIRYRMLLLLKELFG
jgi:hypothetical protein